MSDLTISARDVAQAVGLPTVWRMSLSRGRPWSARRTPLPSKGGP